MKKNRYRILGLTLGILAILCVGYGWYQYTQENRAGEDYEELREEVVHTPTPTPTETFKEKSQELPEETPTPKETKAPIEIPIDFQALRERNPDAYAWIQIPGTNVDYPILQHGEDDNYYLSHTIDHEEKAEGAIFTQRYNGRDLEDPNTVIYGHDMKNGSMFQSLHRYMDRSFFDKHREVTIYLENEIRRYKIFAAYLYDNRHIMESFDFTNEDVYEQYLQEIFSMRDMNSFADPSVEVTKEDKIITMSTCYAGDTSVRYLVQAVLVSIEK